jgi:hypothetical protein
MVGYPAVIIECLTPEPFHSGPSINEASKHIHHMLEARHFTIFTDPKSTYAFQQMRDKWSTRQFNHPDLIPQLTTDIRHVSGQDKIVADALSHVESVTVPPSHNMLAASQDTDDKLRTFPASDTALWLEKQQLNNLIYNLNY